MLSGSGYISQVSNSRGALEGPSTRSSLGRLGQEAQKIDRAHRAGEENSRGQVVPRAVTKYTARAEVVWICAQAIMIISRDRSCGLLGCGSSMLGSEKGGRGERRTSRSLCVGCGTWGPAK